MVVNQNSRRLLVCVVAFPGLSLVLNRQPVFGAEPEPRYGFVAGKSMAFHVVDFIGKGPRSGGCPSVMISNSRKMGVELSALRRSPSSATR